MWHLFFVSMYVINNFESSGLSHSLQPHTLKLLSGGVLTTWSLTCLKQWRSWTSGCPSGYPPTHYHEQFCDCSGVRFLGTTISKDLKWDNHIESIVKKVQQRLYFLRLLRKFNLPQELLIQFYSDIIESAFCTSITVWFSSATKSDLRRLRRVVRTAEQIIGTTLPTLVFCFLLRKRVYRI